MESGEGIVQVMDSHPGTATKNDGQFETSFGHDDGGFSRFYDDVNDVLVIVEEEFGSADSWRVLACRPSSWTY